MRLGHGVVTFPLGLLIVLTTTLVGPGAPAGAADVVPTSLARSAATVQAENDAMAVVNRRRASAGCRPLVVSSALRTAARRHSATMARQRNLSHRAAGESTLSRRILAAGYTGATMVGEVIAYGPRSGAQVVQLWMSSRLHRGILLNCRFRHFGAGVVVDSVGRTWWTIDLARR